MEFWLAFFLTKGERVVGKWLNEVPVEDLSSLILLIAMLIGKIICMVPYGPKTSKADV